MKEFTFDALNAEASRLKVAGDEDELLELAKEAGLDQEDAEDYIDDATDMLASPLMGAMGRLKLESKELEIGGVLKDWVDELIQMAAEDSMFARAVMEKSLAGYIAKTADQGFKDRVKVVKEIVDLTEDVKKVIGNHEFAIGIPDKRTRRSLAKEYYMNKTER